MRLLVLSFFFFNDTATTEIYTLSLHDALPISAELADRLSGAEETLRRDAAERQDDFGLEHRELRREEWRAGGELVDRKSTRLNSSHLVISYAVFCLKKKKTRCLCAL